MTNRTPEMDCLLCLEQKAAQTNSHIVPAGLLKSNIGNRDYEEAYTIAPTNEKSLDSFMGRSNLKNTNTTIKQNPHTLDYIFCPSCEKELAIWESEINPILSKDIFENPLTKNFQIKTLNQISYLECLKINSERFVLFFYSVTWRMCLRHKILENQDFILPQEFEKLRKIIYENLPKQKKPKENILIKEVPLLISTCLSADLNRTGNSVICHPSHSNPYCFYINDFIVLIFFSDSDSLKEKIGKNNPISTLIIDNFEKPIQIGLLKKDAWVSKQRAIADTLATMFIERYANELSKISQMSFEESKTLLHSQAKIISEQTGMEYAEAFAEGFRRITAID